LPANAPKPAAIRAVAAESGAKNEAPATEGAE
ncbi:50S ribosomal protein L3, partial [Mesorhizobium sp. M7A.F.Ca.CA.004.12.1.1]